MSFRPIKEKKLAQPFTEGAGVSLFRAFGFSDPDECDPFLMLDDFRNDDPEKYFTKEVLDKIDEIAKRKFQYGSEEDEQ